MEYQLSRKPTSAILHCPDCGEYLGDYVGGLIYKFGNVVNKPHICSLEPANEYANIESEKRIRNDEQRIL